MRVEAFEYLGSLIDKDGDCSKVIKRRLATASKKLVEMDKLWRSEDKEMKLRIIKSIVFPTAVYGRESWTISKKMAARINAFENKCYRKILNVHWTNESVYSELSVKPGVLLGFVKTQKLK